MTILNCPQHGPTPIVPYVSPDVATLARSRQALSELKVVRWLRHDEYEAALETAEFYSEEPSFSPQAASCLTRSPWSTAWTKEMCVSLKGPSLPG